MKPAEHSFWDQPWPVQLMTGVLLLIAGIGVAGAMGLIAGTFMRAFRWVAG